MQFWGLDETKVSKSKDVDRRGTSVWAVQDYDMKGKCQLTGFLNKNPAATKSCSNNTTNGL